MKGIGFLLVLVAVCQAATEPRSTPESTRVSARAFFESCDGWNFTYDSALAGALEDVSIPLLDGKEIEAGELETHLDHALAGKGLDARPVGPPELKTFLIQRAG